MNDLQKELQELKAKIADLESRISAEPVKWQPKGGYWQVDCGGDVVSVDFFRHQKESGTKRITKEQAERAAVEMRRFNRLLALRDELCGDEDMDWGAYDEKYYVYLSHEDSKWDWTYDKDCQRIQPYFCSREEAQKACNMLNSGEVEL